MSIYRNGTLYGSSNSVGLTPNSIEPSTSNFFGRSQYSTDHYIDAKFDEFRLSNISRSSDWVLTEFNNQNTPASFYNVSAEFSASSLCIN